MKAQLLGGPLDGATFESPERAVEPEMMHFSESRRVHHYLVSTKEDRPSVYTFNYLSRDTILDDRQGFEDWWRKRGGGDAGKEVAWEAWHEALVRSF